MTIDYAFSENSWGNLFYKIDKTIRNYDGAKAQCESDGAFLAIPRSQAENDFLTDLLPYDNFWIGINDIEEQGNFVTVDGSDISWTNWGPDEPGGPAYEDAVAILDSAGQGGQWYDLAQSSGMKSICSIYIEGTNFPFELFRPFYHN